MAPWWRGQGFLAVAICCICCSCLMAPGCGGWATPGGYAEGQQQPVASWFQLTRDNFTSVLKEHEFSLCIAALPWCGESKSLMKGIRKIVEEHPRSFLGLQLFFVHTHKDRLLGQAILGDSIPPSFTLFRYGTPYKYTGRRSISSMMASIRQGMTVLRSDTVLGRIESPEDMENFADSTDKAVILFEFCGWETMLQQKQRKISITDDVDSVDSEEILDGSEIPGNSKTKKNEGAESSALDGVDKSSSEGEDSSYGMQSEDKLIKTEPRTQDIRHKDHLPTFDASFEQPVQKSERRIGDELDDIADCIIQNSLYCTARNTFQSLEHALSTDANSGDNWETAGAKDVKNEEGKHDQPLCTNEEYERFKVVYGNVSSLAADNVLTPQRLRFATATNEEIASHVGISTQGRPWLLMYLIHDFDRLPYCFNGLGTVEDFIFDHSPPLVFELEGEGHNSASSALLNDTPSVILFIDRMSNSSDVREKSKAALDAVQELSYHYASQQDDRGQNGRQRRKHKVQKKSIADANEKAAVGLPEEQKIAQTIEPVELLALLEKPNLYADRLRQADRNFVFQLLTDQHQLSKISGRDVLLGNRDFLSKLSQLKLLEGLRQSLAVGADSWSSPVQVSHDRLHSDRQTDKILGHRHNEDLPNHCTLSNEQVNQGDDDGLGRNPENITPDMAPEEHQEYMTETASIGEEEAQTSLSERSASRKWSLLPEGENGGSAASSSEGKSSTFQRDADRKLTNEGDVQHLAEDEDNDESSTYRNELGFYFIDGEDPMKEKLARGKEIPALVIIDPERQAHYSFPSDVVNATTLSSFVDSFLSGLLRRTIFSEPKRPPPRQPLRPPFVNQDFHEMYPVPRVTVDSFLELVEGVNKADNKCNQYTVHRGGREESEDNGGNLTESAWDKDVMVLFTTPWCGFCKRMELVMREAYRSLQLVKSHENQSNGNINNSDDLQNLNDPTASSPARFAGGAFAVNKVVQTGRMDAAVREPVLLQMDCTMNDCSDYLGQILEEETYPAVVLFPARNKLSPVIYSDAPTVRGIHEFLNVHGAVTASAEKQEGNSPNENLIIREGKVCTTANDVSCESVAGSTSIKIGSGPGRGSKHEAATLLWEVNSRHMDFGKHVEVGSILLASEKLLDASPVFENAIILIIRSNPQGMVHGLIVSKPIAWKNVVGLETKMEDLLNSAALGYGGPVVDNQRPFLVLTHLQGLEEFTEVLPGIYCGFVPSKGRILEMIHTGRLAAKDFWFFLGYSSWTWRQLQSELMGDLWQARPFSDDLVKWPIQWTT